MVSGPTDANASNTFHLIQQLAQNTKPGFAFRKLSKTINKAIQDIKQANDPGEVKSILVNLNESNKNNELIEKFSGKTTDGMLLHKLTRGRSQRKRLKEGLKELDPATINDDDLKMLKALKAVIEVKAVEHLFFAYPSRDAELRGISELIEEKIEKADTAKIRNEFQPYERLRDVKILNSVNVQDVIQRQQDIPEALEKLKANERFKEHPERDQILKFLSDLLIAVSDRLTLLKSDSQSAIQFLHKLKEAPKAITADDLKRLESIQNHLSKTRLPALLTENNKIIEISDFTNASNDFIKENVTTFEDKDLMIKFLEIDAKVRQEGLNFQLNFNDADTKVFEQLASKLGPVTTPFILLTDRGGQRQYAEVEDLRTRVSNLRKAGEVNLLKIEDDPKKLDFLGWISISKIIEEQGQKGVKFSNGEIMSLLEVEEKAHAAEAGVAAQSKQEERIDYNVSFKNIEEFRKNVDENPELYRGLIKNVRFFKLENQATMSASEVKRLLDNKNPGKTEEEELLDNTDSQPGKVVESEQQKLEKGMNTEAFISYMRKNRATYERLVSDPSFKVIELARGVKIHQSALKNLLENNP